MIEFLSKKLTSFLFANNVIEDKDIEVYNYVFETTIAFLINIFFILLLGGLLNRLLCTIIFLIFYCPIRQFSGGYHAENYRRCLLIFILIYICNFIILERFIIGKNLVIFFMISFFSFIGIYINCPFEHREHKLSNNQRRKYKIIVLIGLLLDILLFIIGINYKLTYIHSIYMLSVINVIYIFIILGKVKEKIQKGSKNYLNNF